MKTTPKQGGMKQVFLSYARKQRPIAEEINVALSVRGYKVFFDRDTLKAGKSITLRSKRRSRTPTCLCSSFLRTP